VEEGLIGEMEDPFEAVKWQQVLGGEGLVAGRIAIKRIKMVDASQPASQSSAHIFGERAF
jgi:hypothetical protein